MKTTKIKNILLICGILAIGLALGYFIAPTHAPREADHSTDTEVAEHTHSADETIWTCSMHPQIRMNEPGDCPICGMELIPLEPDGENKPTASALKMTPTAMALAGVETMTVGSSAGIKKINLNGKIQADERRVYVQSSHVAGRIEALNIDFTGEHVSKGQTLGSIYSPELVTAQRELIEAEKIRESQPALFEAAKQKLRNIKLSEAEIQAIIDAGQIRENLSVTADISGYVTDKMVSVGDYVQRGQALYRIADLSQLWVMLDVYESDLEWIKKGDEVFFTVPSLPGRKFSGKIDFIDPVINPETRVSKARLSIANPDDLLKPEMFVRATVETTTQESDAAIAVPKSAVMWTGKRSVVYVKEQTDDAVFFEMREVTLGPELGEKYLIKEGLKPGESIAVHGTFSIDAAAQLAGKPSMMSPESKPRKATMGKADETVLDEQRATAQKPVKIDSKASAAINTLLATYLELKDNLVADQFETAKQNMKLFAEEIHELDESLTNPKALELWKSKQPIFKTALGEADLYKNIGELRKAFRHISENLIAFLQATDYSHQELVVDYCPMANSNKGAVWLSTDSTIRNPYFGEVMLSCGEVKADFK